MKHTKLLFSLAAASLLLPACQDEVMEWKNPDASVRPQELPLELREKIDKYDFIKNYMSQYHPNVAITLGMGLDIFLDDETYKQTVLDNFQGVTFGNALKHQSVVQSNGSYNWTTVDRFLAMNTGLPIHGHNIIWHTQQQQAYLKSLIAPEMVIESDPTNDILNMLGNDESNFDSGSKGKWGSWGNGSSSDVVAPGRGDEGYCLHLSNPEDADKYSAQAAVTFDTPLEPGTYKIRFYAKSSTPAGILQFQYQNGATYGSQGGYNDFNVGTDWVLCEYEFELTFDDVNRILINFGGIAGEYYIDDVEFGLKQDAPSDPMINILPAEASDFEGNADGSTGGWGSWGSGKDSVETQEGAGKDGSVGVVLKNKGDGDAWEAQFAYTFDDPLLPGTPYMITFDAKALNPGGHLQFQYQNGTTYGSQGGYNDFEISTDWMPCEYEFTIADYDDVDRIILNFGKIDNTYYIDNIKFGQKIEAATKASTRASISYKLKTAEEKYAALDAAMEDWIKEAMNHVGKYCTSYDVINEPIGDDSNFRGIDGKGWSGDDKEPEESVESGLNLNWESGAGNGHFYWGYYMGMDYAVKAFEYTRKYANEAGNPDMKLFVNDYNLEISPSKLNKLIEFVKYIDNNGGHVDGIGTQMHVNAKSITKEQVDAMFQTLAATGKLIRITELDVALGTSAPSLEEQQLQSDVYQMILTSFFENVPESQQHGITIWSLTDGAKEHEYWLNGDTPNIFNADFSRKIAYKGVCDAIIGFDPSEDWESPDYSKTNSEE